MKKEEVTIILGDEYDDFLRDVVRAVLVKNGAIPSDRSWGIGGSQEIETIQVRIGDDLITIESETFVGLSIAGSKLLVNALAQQIRKGLKCGKRKGSINC